ncbi:MAG TPA: hypothetical protein VGQ99_00700 [Tepidisphaeraceae bacterium]|nr:hypothetical protein [Tepidisphaeraceae bacterium]
MTCSHRVLVTYSLLGILCVPGAWGQIAATVPAGGGAIPAAVKSASVMDAGGETQIKAFIGEQVGKFRELNTEGIPKSREVLVAEAKGGSPAYLAKYAEVLNGEILNVLKDVKDMRGRLNAAIVVARVAEIANNTKLEKSVLALLDKGQPEALKLWGMRAARSVLPELVKVNGEKPLIEAVIATAKQFPTNGPLAQDAYDALNPRNVPAKSVPAIVDPLLDLLVWRLEIYKNGVPGSKTLVPDDPLADATPIANVLHPDAWKNLDRTKKQDVRVMQLACEMFVLSATRGDDGAYQKYREQLKDSIVKMSASLYVTASVMNEEKLKDAAGVVNKGASGQAVNLVSLVMPLCEQISHVKGFEEVKPPQIAPQQVAPQGQGTPAAADQGAGGGGTGTAGGGEKATGGNIPGAVVVPAK